MAIPIATGSAPPSLPPLNIDKQSGRATPPTRTPIQKKTTSAAESNAQHLSQYRYLTPNEWARLAHGLGAVKDGEDNALVHPTCWYWPPRGMPNGLYKDVVFEKTKNFYHFHMIYTIQWILLILQIMLGAVLTALGAISMKDKIPITVLAAINTVAAGVLALMHSSGVPDRLLRNKNEYSNVVDYVKELIETAIVENDMTVDDAIAHCFDRYHAVKQTVQANQPENYMPSSSITPAVRMSGLNPRSSAYSTH